MTDSVVASVVLHLEIDWFVLECFYKSRNCCRHFRRWSFRDVALSLNEALRWLSVYVE